MLSRSTRALRNPTGRRGGRLDQILMIRPTLVPFISNLELFQVYLIQALNLEVMYDYEMYEHHQPQGLPFLRH
jgi:hypothetical protein